MKKICLVVIVAFGAASICRAGDSIENLRSMSGNLNIGISQAQEIDELGSPSPAHFQAREYIPHYGQLPRILLSEPWSTIEGLRTWMFSPIAHYESEVEATAVMEYWKEALEKSGVPVVSYSTSSMVGFYEFKIMYTGDNYLQVYESPNSYTDKDRGQAEMNSQTALMRRHGLTIVKSILARTGEKYMFMTYYLVHYDKDKNSRHQVCKYDADSMQADEASALEAAQSDRKAFEQAGVPVLDVEIISGPRGAIYQIHYVGKNNYPQNYSKNDFKSEALARQAMDDFIREIEKSNAVILEARVYPSGPWFEDWHSFRVRYLLVK